MLTFHEVSQFLRQKTLLSDFLASQGTEVGYMDRQFLANVKTFDEWYMVAASSCHSLRLWIDLCFFTIFMSNCVDNGIIICSDYPGS